MVRDRRPASVGGVRGLVSRCDICVVDLDECIYPRFTQTILGASMLARSLHPRRLRFLPRLAAGATYITAVRILQLLGRHPSNIELMRSFSWVMRGMPMAFLEGCAARLPSRGPREWRRALGTVAARMPVYLLTFSIELIARAYASAGGAEGGRIFSGYRGTPVDARAGSFRGCLFNESSFTPAAKAAELSRILEETGRSRPLVIGHGVDEAAMFKAAEEMGGGSIALCRSARAAARLGASLHISSWRDISAALME